MISKHNRMENLKGKKEKKKHLLLGFAARVRKGGNQEKGRREERHKKSMNDKNDEEIEKKYSAKIVEVWKKCQKEKMKISSKGTM